MVKLQTSSLKFMKDRKAQLLQRPHDVLCHYFGRPKLGCLI